MGLRLLAGIAVIPTVMLAASSGLPLSSARDRIAYGPYVAVKAYDQIQGGWTVRITRAGAIAGVLFNGGDVGIASKEDIQFGVHRLLGKEQEQLIVRFWTGGNRCCDTYWILDLRPELRVVYDGRWLTVRDAGEGFQAADLDGDGQLEFWLERADLDAYSGATFMALSAPVLIYFKYEEAEGRYKPANLALSRYILDRLQPTIRAVRAANAKHDFSRCATAEACWDYDVNYASRIVVVVMSMTYAGKDAEAWTFFDREYRPRNREKLKAYIKQSLTCDRLYLRYFAPPPPPPR